MPFSAPLSYSGVYVLYEYKRLGGAPPRGPSNTRLAYELVGACRGSKHQIRVPTSLAVLGV